MQIGSSFSILIALITLMTLFLGLSLSTEQCRTQSHLGKKFILGFPYSEDSTKLEIYLSSVERNFVRVSTPYYSFAANLILGSNSSRILKMPPYLNYCCTNKVRNGSLLVEADKDVQVNVMALSQNYPGGYLALPIDSLSTEYILASYKPYSSYSSSVIASLDKSTNVTIQVRTTRNETVNGLQFYNNATIKTVLQNYQIFPLTQTEGDITGTVIKSDYPVAVFSAVYRTILPVESSASADYIVEQLVPVQNWGKIYIIPPLYHRPHQYVRAIAGYDGTSVDLYDSSRTSNYQLQKTEFFEVRLDTSAAVISSNNPIEVIQYSPGHLKDDASTNVGTFMAVVPAVDQFSKDYFSLLTNSTQSFQNYLAITIQKNKKSGLKLNGSPLSVLSESAVSQPLDNYTVITVNSTTANVNITHQSKDTTFAVLAYGYKSARAYGFPLGFQFSNNGCGLPTDQSVSPPPIHNQHSATTAAHNGQQGSFNDKMCFKCSDMIGPSFCETVAKCGEAEVCFLEKYQTSGEEGHIRFNSGCGHPGSCSIQNQTKQDLTGLEHILCTECCSESFCNNKGCNEAGLPPRNLRGPMCFDCGHLGDPRQCDTMTLCPQGQLCSVERFFWGPSTSRYVMGCRLQQHCDLVGVQKRTHPNCLSCCADDFCNRDCVGTHQAGPVIG